MKIPPYLKKGDTIGIMCPAGYMALEKAQTCINTLQEWGFKVIVGNTLGSNSTTYFSGTDEERCYDLQTMLDDNDIKAVLFGRGGYGIGRIIDDLNFKYFKKNPKWLIGFSDITVLHTHLFTNYKIATMHAPMAAAFNDGEWENEYVQSILKAIKGKKGKYSCEPHSFNKLGSATGKIIGGNLALLTTVIGTESDYDTNNCILFIEDIGEQMYNIDRMLYQMKRSGKLDGLAGLIFGGFTDMKDTERPFGLTMDEILQNITTDLNIPICYHFPISHDKENVAIKCGLNYNLIVGKNKVSLQEL